MAISNSRNSVKQTHKINLGNFINDVDTSDYASVLSLDSEEGIVGINLDGVMDILKDSMSFLKDIDASALKEMEKIMQQLIGGDLLISGLDSLTKKNLMSELGNQCTNLYGIEGLSFKLPRIELYGLLALLLALLCNGVKGVFNALGDVIGDGLTSLVVSQIVPGMIKNDDGKNSFNILSDLAGSRYGTDLVKYNNSLGRSLDVYYDKDSYATRQPTKKFESGFSSLKTITGSGETNSKALKSLSGNSIRGRRTNGFGVQPQPIDDVLRLFIK